ncbi:hypothetical protein Pmani_012734 [Petrolisthes manimaculis]|uniref:Uncharacterized protein n=1 Tax=Petrolisthes manimaculis TaxID=1843537 RepID=A0AAE1PYI0_9EUCA|nr:hypothetical protein Pmani_012734 [Petrolisthes manimaculis]
MKGVERVIEARDVWERRGQEQQQSVVKLFIVYRELVGNWLGNDGLSPRGRLQEMWNIATSALYSASLPTS